MQEKSDRNGIKVISRAAAILRVLRDDPSGLSLGQIAERVDLPRSTVQRIAAALAEERFVMSTQKRGSLRLGPEIGSLAEATRYSIVDWCRPILSEIAQETGETTDLAVLRDGQMIFLDQIAGQHRLSAISSVGETFPISSTANGRACLAILPEDEARRQIRREWTRTHVTGDMDALIARLEEVRDTGLAYDLDEHTQGISAVGLAFLDWAGAPHSISVPVPSTRFDEARPRIEAALCRARAQLEAQLD